MGCKLEGEISESFLKLMMYSQDDSLMWRHNEVWDLISKQHYADALQAAQRLVKRVSHFSSRESEKLLLKMTVIDFLNGNVYYIRGRYLPGDQMKIGQYVDATVHFVEGGGHNVPGFWVDDGVGGRRRCKIRWSDAKEGDVEKLLISDCGNEEVVLDPRPERGDMIRIRYRRRFKPQFRFMRYVGIIEEGVFERKYFYEAKVVRFHRDVKVGRRPRQILHLGKIYAEPIKQLEICNSKKEEMMNYRIVRN